MASLGVGQIGLGTVGSGVARILTDHQARTAQRAGRQIDLVQVAVRDLSRPRSVELPADRLTDDPLAVVRNPRVAVVLELMGGTGPARDYVAEALRCGKHVVTANKALLCEHGDELFRLAREHGVCIAFEAAVAGGVPIIGILGQAMSGNQITAIEAIINGTSNFILTEMFQRDASYADAVGMAQELGYAEADPSMDVDGTDAAQKLGILTLLAFGTRVPLSAFPRQGIDTIELADLKYAHELGYAVKLLATARLVKGRLEMHVQPTLIRRDRPIAQVDGPNNMIALTGDAVGQVWFSGMGAGQMPTASAVVSDLVDVATGRAPLTFGRLDLWGEHPPFPLQASEEIYRRYYLRFNVEDRPHVMADVTDVLGRHGISLASVIQHETPEVEEGRAAGVPTVPLVIMTHRTTEGQLRRASSDLGALDCLRKPRYCMPVSD